MSIFYYFPRCDGALVYNECNRVPKGKTTKDSSFRREAERDRQDAERDEREKHLLRINTENQQFEKKLLYLGRLELKQGDMAVQSLQTLIDNQKFLLNIAETREQKVEASTKFQKLLRDQSTCVRKNKKR